MGWRTWPVALLFLVSTFSSAACHEVVRNEAANIDPFRELEIVDDDVVDDVRAKNANAGPWSFRHLAIETAGGSEEIAARVVERSLERSTAFADLLQGWPRAENGYLDLSRAPLRLVAISNRLDLGKAPDAFSPAGEGRFVFAITRGPADDAASESTPATIILEYALPSTRSPAEWAAAWHALGRLDDRESYRRALEALTRTFADRGSALAQVRASKQDGDHVTLYELAFDREGDISARGLRNTPRPNVESDASFQEWARANEAEIRGGRHVLPASFRADVADTGSPTVVIAGASEDLQRAFDVGTCNGCHRASNGGIDGGFHVSPLRRGRDRISVLLREDLTRRAIEMQEELD